MYYAEIEYIAPIGPGIPIGPTGHVKRLHDPLSVDYKLTDGVITQSLNTINSFTFTLLPNHPLFADDIEPYRTTVRVYDDDNLIFLGRILDPTRKMDSGGMLYKSYVAEDELAYLLDSMQQHGEYHNITPEEYLGTILEVHNNAVNGNQIDKAIYLGDVNVTNSTDNLYRYMSYASSFQNIQEDLVRPLGGYIKLRYGVNGIRYLDYTVESGVTEKAPIELAVNLRAIESQYRPSEIITMLMPLGAEMDSPQNAIIQLESAGIIDDAEFWLETYTEIAFLDQLLINLSKRTYSSSIDNEIRNVDAAITFLSAASVLSDTQYWDIAGGGFLKLSNLLIRAANQMDTSAIQNAEAAKPRLTIDGIYPGEDVFISDEELIKKYGIIQGAVVWNDVTVVENLRSKGVEWMQNQTLANSVKIDAVDLSENDEYYKRYVCGNTYQVLNEFLEIEESYKLIEQQLDIVNPLNSKLYFGDRTIRASESFIK